MFKDRKDAAENLAKSLKKYSHEDVLVLGIPRGGVETAYYVAKKLKSEMSVVITRKLGFPGNPEAAFGAVAEDGSIYISEAGKGLSQQTINSVLEQQKHEISRRVQKFRNGKPLPEMKGRTVIITDDGIATGATIFATIELCKKRKAAKIVVAAPVGGSEMEDILNSWVDDVVILEKPLFYRSVSQGYLDFQNLSDEDTVAFLNRWEKEHMDFHK